MENEVEVARTGVTKRQHAGRNSSSRIFEVFKYFLISAFLVIAITHAKPSSSASDELLLKLMAVSRKGAAALCDPAHIKNHLAVRFHENPGNQEFNGDFSSIANSSDQFFSGSYSKFNADRFTVCKLRLRVAGDRFCNSDSARTQRLLGRRAQPRLPMLGEPGHYDHGYELARDPTQRTILGWREPSRACPVDVEVVAATR